MNLLRPIHSALCLLLMTGITSSVMAQVQETREVSIKDFSEIHVTTGIELIITQGATESARIVADQSLVDAVVVEQSGSSINVKWGLIKSTKKKWLNRTAKVLISFKNLNLIEATEGSAVKTENVLKSNILSITVASGANISATVDCPELQMKTNSGASASLKGTAGKMTLESSSGSRVNALEMTTGYANVTANSGADVKLNVTKELGATANSGGNIRYKGDPVVENSAGSKSGNVKRLD